MPNWCQVEMIIKGDVDTLSRMNEIMLTEGHARHPHDDTTLGQPMNLVPMPEELRGTRSPAPSGEYDADGKRMEWVNSPDNAIWTAEKYAADKAEWVDLIKRAERAKDETGHDNWHSWTRDHWGTKWSMEVCNYVHNAHEIVIAGQTAWGPPLGLLSSITRMYPVTISAEYSEEGMDFIGVAIYKNSEELGLSEGSIHDFLPKDFDWEDDDAWDIAEDVKQKLLVQHWTRANGMSFRSTFG